jgi:hypothetical protein
MLYFLVPLRPKETSFNWRIVQDCFKKTIQSVLNQTDLSCHLVVVCHQFPFDDLRNQPNITVIEANIPIPKTLEEQMTDKTEKKKIGLDYIYNNCNKNDFVMLLDADDIVANKVTTHINNNLNSPGFYIPKGYKYYFDQNKIIPLQALFFDRRLHFHKMCGSSLIFNLSIVPKEIIIGSHMNAVENCKKAGYPLKPIPFRAAIYVCDTGNNHMAQRFPKKRNPLKRLKSKFYDWYLVTFNPKYKQDLKYFPTSFK